jgi:anaerobic ribonucleoside-triphosphate reductase activating protein
VQIIKDSEAEYGIEGVTYLGGEPVLQTGIKYLSSEIKKLNLGIILFTGRLYSELDDDIINSADLIIDGGFEKNNLEDKRNLIGSRNQKMFFVTDRYKKYEEWFFIPRPKETEINVSDVLTINGDYLIKPVLGGA